MQGKLAEAEVAYRRAIALQPDYAEPHCNLAEALRRQGKFADALELLRRGHELGSKNPSWRYPSAHWVRDCERLLALDRKLPAVLKGEVTPADAAEQAALADFCGQYKRLYASAARFYAGAFAADPKLADNVRQWHRYNAARCAALAAAGKGVDATRLDDKEQARLRQRALGWLRADLGFWSGLAGKDDPRARQAVRQTLGHWQQDADLAGVRDKEALAKLPEAERKEWQKLWADVAALLEKSSRQP